MVVIGAGRMGGGIAEIFALRGTEVLLIDPVAGALERARAGLEKRFQRLVGKGKISEAQAGAALERVSFVPELSAARDGGFAIEAVPEDPDLKRRVHTELDALLAPAAIIATNTSSISITELASATERADRFIGMHFFNPVPVMALVEVIRGHATSHATCQAVMEIARGLGKTPVEVSDYPGFVANRVLIPMINEAVYCVMEGVASPQAVDEVMKLGMNHPMGPLQLADFIGLDVCLHIMKVLHEGLGDPKYRPCPLLSRMVAAGQLGQKSGKGFFVYADR